MGGATDRIRNIKLFLLLPISVRSAGEPNVSNVVSECVTVLLLCYANVQSNPFFPSDAMACENIEGVYPHPPLLNNQNEGPAYISTLFTRRFVISLTSYIQLECPTIRLVLRFNLSSDSMPAHFLARSSKE